ncbi:hypothetical protein ACWCXC_31370 [Streptomyces sp. NPDC001515]
MHDPLTVAFEIRRPWPKGEPWRTEQAARNGTRWQINGAFWGLAGHGLYFPPLVTVWHRDPSGYDSTTWSIYPGRSWRFHVYHWRLQVHPLQRWRRRLLTRCTWCGGRSVKGDWVNVSHSWDGPRPADGRAKRGSSTGTVRRSSAHSTCVCESPVLDGNSYGQCAACDRFRPFGVTEANLARARDLQQVPLGGRKASSEEAPDA